MSASWLRSSIPSKDFVTEWSSKPTGKRGEGAAGVYVRGDPGIVKNGLAAIFLQTNPHTWTVSTRVVLDDPRLHERNLLHALDKVINAHKKRYGFLGESYSSSTVVVRNNHRV